MPRFEDEDEGEDLGAELLDCGDLELLQLEPFELATGTAIRFIGGDGSISRIPLVDFFEGGGPDPFGGFHA